MNNQTTPEKLDRLIEVDRLIEAGALSVLSYSPMACFVVWWRSLHFGGQGLQIPVFDQLDLRLLLSE